MQKFFAAAGTLLGFFNAEQPRIRYISWLCASVPRKEQGRETINSNYNAKFTVNISPVANLH